MDLSTLLGIIAGFAVVILGIVTKGPILRFWDLSSFLIVVGGTVTAVMVSYPLNKLKDLLKIIKKAFLESSYNVENTIEQFAKLSYIAKKEGLLAMEKVLKDIDSEFMKKGVTLIIDGTEPEMIKKMLELDVENMLDRHSEGEGVLKTFGKFAPAYGMVGTLIGLIIMLNNLEDVSTLGPAMGVALITTFYGSFLANAVFLPLAGKLKYKSENEARYKYMIIEGIISVQNGDSPILIEEKLKTFMNANARIKNEEESNEKE